MVSATLPIYWNNEKKTKKSTTHLCGMNFYRNQHYHVKNKLKKDIEELAINQLKQQAPITTQYTVEYTLYYKSKVCDGSNVIALMEKFFLDALQAANLVAEDNVQYHVGSSWSVGGCDKDNPRCEITVKELTHETP